MNRRAFVRAGAKWWLATCVALHAFGCAAFGKSTSVTAAQMVEVVRELAGIVNAVAERVLPHGAPDALLRHFARTRDALDAVLTALVADRGRALPPEEARRLFGRFLDAYAELWLELRSTDRLGPSGELLADGLRVPTVEDCKACIARGTGQAT